MWLASTPRSNGDDRAASIVLDRGEMAPLVPSPACGRGWLRRRRSRERAMGVAQAKRLRSEMTDAEQRLWYRLRAHRFRGYKFKRQVPIGPYVVDFACLNLGLVIEVDGGQHAESIHDRRRTAWLRKRGLHVLRFWNHEVLRSTDAVLEGIMKALTEREAQPLSRRATRATLSPAGRGDAAAQAAPTNNQS
jgi:very-short-patch-repair endonuclease